MRVYTAFVVFLCLVAPLLFGAQDCGDLVKNRRNEYKIFKNSDAIQCDSILHLLQSRHWVVEIDRIPGRRGSSISIGDDEFFVAVNGAEAVLCIDTKTRSEKSCSAVHAAVEQYAVSQIENQYFYQVHFVVKGEQQEFTVSVEINASTGVAWLNISGKRMRKAVFIGHITSLNQSKLNRTTATN